MTLHNTFYNHQPNAASLEFLCSMKPFKDMKHLVGGGHIEASAIILDFYELAVTLREGCNHNLCIIAQAGKFDRIPQNILK